MADRQYWVTDVKKTWLGDTNLDNVFDSGDMIAVFLAGEYEDAIDGNSTCAVFVHDEKHRGTENTEFAGS